MINAVIFSASTRSGSSKVKMDINEESKELLEVEREDGSRESTNMLVSS